MRLFADEKSVEAGDAEFGEVVVSAQTRFADGDAVVGNAVDQLEGSLDAQVESLQVAIVDADDAGAGGKRAVEFGGGVNLDERLHAEFAAESDQVAKKLVAESSDDQQETVGVVGARFPDLPGIEDKILAKDGELDGFARIAQIFQRAAKKFSFGEHGERSRACRFQRARQLNRIEWIAKNSARGRSGLQLGDHVEAVAT